MTALTDFITTLKGWVNREDLSDAVVTSWIRMGEERINDELLYKDMLKRQRAVFTDNCTPLPVDWIKVQYVKYVRTASDNPNLARGRSFGFVSADDYWERVRTSPPSYRSEPVYTIIGNDLFITGDVGVAGVEVEVGVYRKVPPLVDSNWLYEQFPALYTFASLAASAPFLMEDERMATWESKATQLIQLMNEKSRDSQTGASPMRIRRRSFG